MFKNFHPYLIYIENYLKLLTYGFILSIFFADLI